MSDKKVPVNLLENLPEDGNYANDDGAVFPSMEQQEKAREIITNGWDAAVGVKVRKYVDPDTPSQ